MGRTPTLLSDAAIIAALEPLDSQAGIDSESILLGKADVYSWLFMFGSVTGDSVMKFYLGATSGAKTTAVDFSYRLVGADYKAAAADTPWGALTAVVAATGLTLTAATFDHRMLLVEFSAVALATVAGGTQNWLTCAIDGTATVLLMSGIVLARGLRYGAPDTMISTA